MTIRNVCSCSPVDFLEQVELRARAAIFDILACDGSRDQPPLIGEQIVGLGIVGGSGAHLRRQTARNVGVEKAEQPGRHELLTRIIARYRYARLDAAVDARQSVGPLGAQQRRRRTKPTPRRLDIQIGRKAIFDECFERRIVETLPPVAGKPVGR